MSNGVSQFFKAVRLAIVADVPPELQACEACREAECTQERYTACRSRQKGEKQEKTHRQAAVA
jgi:hypothetical protein